MGHQQRQCYCNRCGRATLHTRDTYDVPHLIHLIITLLCCGLWLPIWILHALSNSLGSTVPFLCAQCGQAVGQRTEEQQAALWKERREVAAKAASAGVTMSATAWVTARSAARGFWGELRKLPGQTDRALRVIAGEGNDILYRFFQLLTVALTAALLVVILAMIFSSLRWLMS